MRFVHRIGEWASQPAPRLAASACRRSCAFGPVAGARPPEDTLCFAGMSLRGSRPVYAAPSEFLCRYHGQRLDPIPREGPGPPKCIRTASPASRECVRLSGATNGSPRSLPCPFGEKRLGARVDRTFHATASEIVLGRRNLWLAGGRGRHGAPNGSGVGAQRPIDAPRCEVPPQFQSRDWPVSFGAGIARSVWRGMFLPECRVASVCCARERLGPRGIPRRYIPANRRGVPYRSLVFVARPRPAARLDQDWKHSRFALVAARKSLA
jgi:hypothetical protein